MEFRHEIALLLIEKINEIASGVSFHVFNDAERLQEIVDCIAEFKKNEKKKRFGSMMSIL